MRLAASAPAGWDARIAFPLQSVGFAEASRALGYRPLFAEDADGCALVLVRRVPIPLVAGLTTRAKVHAHAARAAFVGRLAEALRREGISHVRLGDSLWGFSGEVPEPSPGLRPVDLHVLVHDLTRSEADVLAGAKRMIRRHLRKLADEVRVSRVRTQADLRAYLALTAETGARMRGRDVAAVYPPAYLETLFREMVSRGDAVMFLARAGEAPLAAATFAIGRDRFAQIHGCSTRDRALTPKQGPTLLFWHAMQYARAQGCRTFDMGAVTPTDDPRHPHYSVYEYKKLWGGRLERRYSAELVMSPWKHRFQELALAPLWDSLHPVYLRLFGDGCEAPQPVRAMLALSEQEQYP